MIKNKDSTSFDAQYIIFKVIISKHSFIKRLNKVIYYYLRFLYIVENVNGVGEKSDYYKEFLNKSIITLTKMPYDTEEISIESKEDYEDVETLTMNLKNLREQIVKLPARNLKLKKLKLI